jgi:hypothetical protein
MDEIRDSHKVLVGNPFGGLRRRMEDNDNIYLREVGLEGVDWVHLAQDKYQWQAFVNIVMKLRVL